MGHNGRLLVRLQVGHRSEVLVPKLDNGHTHRWTVFVRSHDGEEFRDRSFVEKVVFILHDTFPHPKRIVKEPPFQVTETGYAGFSIPCQIWLAGKQYKITYDLNLTMEPTALYVTPATISVADYPPEFASVAKRFGAERERKKRPRDNDPLLLAPERQTPPTISPPPEKIRKKERSADVSARSSPAPIERLKARMDERDRDLRRAESSISPPIREKPKREEGESKKKKESKLLGFVLDRGGAQQQSQSQQSAPQRPSPAASPAVVEKLRKEEKIKKEGRASSSPSTSTAAERLKKEERKREKEKNGSPSSEREKERKKEKNGVAPAQGEKDKERKKEKEKEKDSDRRPSFSSKDKEKREKDVDRMANSEKKRDKEREKEGGKERIKEEPTSSYGDPTTSSKREKEERKREKNKDRDRSKETATRLPALPGDKTEKDKRPPPSITPPPVLLRMECVPPSGGARASSVQRSLSPPTLVAMGNGRDYAPRPYGGASGSTVTSDGHRARASSIPSLLSAVISAPLTAAAAAGGSSAYGGLTSQQLQQPSPSGSLGGRETPSEKASRSSISPGLRNEETASSGGSSTSSHSSERREMKRIPKLAPSQKEREALSAPLLSVDAASVRRRIEQLTDQDKVFEVAVLLLDLDPSSSLSLANHTPSLSYDLSGLDQKDLLRLDAVLNGS